MRKIKEYGIENDDRNANRDEMTTNVNIDLIKSREKCSWNILLYKQSINSKKTMVIRELRRHCLMFFLPDCKSIITFKPL